MIDTPPMPRNMNAIFTSTEGCTTSGRGDTTGDQTINPHDEPHHVEQERADLAAAQEVDRQRRVGAHDHDVEHDRGGNRAGHEAVRTVEAQPVEHAACHPLRSAEQEQRSCTEHVQRNWSMWIETR